MIVINLPLQRHWHCRRHCSVYFDHSFLNFLRRISQSGQKIENCFLLEKLEIES